MKRAALALLLLAAPAAAQEIDKTRIDVVEFGGMTSCHFAALPGLTLRHGGYWSGRWEAPPIGVSGDRVSLVLQYAAILDANRDKVSRIVAGQFVVYRDQLDGKAAASARLVLDDGGPEIAPLPLGEADGKLTASLRPALARFDASGRAAVTLLDASGAAVASYVWDVTPARRILPLLDAVDWRCREPMM